MQILKSLTLSVVVAATSACSSLPIEEKNEELRLLLGEIQAREQVLDKRQALLDKRGDVLARLELQQEAVAAASGDAVPTVAPNSMSYLPAPVKAELGQCYRLAYLAPRLSAEPQTVVVQDAADQIVVTEPKFVADTVSVIVDYHLPQAESEAVEMQMHERKIVVRPEYRTWEVQPARFDEVADPILLAPAHKNFKSCGVDDGSLERHWCVENVAATYQSVSRRTVTRLADVIEKRVPAEERVLRVRQPVNSDDRSRLQPVMEVIEVQRLSVPASYRREVLLPEFKTVTVRQLTRPAALSWRQVLCEGSVAKPLVALVQEALNERGYDVGEPDGAMGEKTLAAIAQFRLDKMWPDLGRDISLELLSALQIALPQ